MDSHAEADADTDTFIALNPILSRTSTELS